MAFVDQALSTDCGAGFRRRCRQLLRVLGQSRIGPPPHVHDPGATTPPPELAGTKQLRRELLECNRYPREEEVRAAKRLEFLEARVRHFRRRGWDAAEAEHDHHLARNAMIEGGASFAFNVVKIYQGRRISNEDLLQECFVALYSAVRLYDWRTGNRYLTYCNEWFHMACHQAIYTQGRTVRITTQVQKSLKRLADARAEVGDDPQAIEAITGIPESRQRELASVVTQSVTLSSVMDDDDDGAVTDNSIPSVPSVVDDLQDLERHNLLRSTIENLPDARRRLMGLLWGLDTPDGEPMSYYHVGQELGLRPKTVESLEQACLAELGLKIRQARR